MLPKLKSFYMGCILPEILDGRLPRGMRIRDPPDIIENREKQIQKKKKEIVFINID